MQLISYHRLLVRVIWLLMVVYTISVWVGKCGDAQQKCTLIFALVRVNLAPTVVATKNQVKSILIDAPLSTSRV